MSQVNTLTVNDGATTPVSIVLNRYDTDGTRSSFRTSDASLVKGQKELIHSANIGTKANSANVSRLTFVYPIEATVDGLVQVSSVSTATVQINYAPQMTAAQRQAFYGWITNVLTNADVKAQNIAVAPLS